MITYEDIIKYPAGSKERKDLLEQWNIEYLTSLDTTTTPTYHGSRKSIGKNPISKENLEHNDYKTESLWKDLKKFYKIMDSIEDAKYNPRNERTKRLYSNETYFRHKLILGARCWVQNFVDNIGYQVYMSAGQKRPTMKWRLPWNKYKRNTLEETMTTIAQHMVDSLDERDGGVNNNIALQEKEQNKPAHIGFNI